MIILYTLQQLENDAGRLAIIWCQNYSLWPQDRKCFQVCSTFHFKLKINILLMQSKSERYDWGATWFLNSNCGILITQHLWAMNSLYLFESSLSMDPRFERIIKKSQESCDIYLWIIHNQTDMRPIRADIEISGWAYENDASIIFHSEEELIDCHWLWCQNSSCFNIWI